MLRSVISLRSQALKARDGDIGNCKDFLFDDQFWTIRYMVADTGSWLTGRKVLVSPMSIVRSDWKHKYFEVNLTKDEIQEAPPLDADAPVSRQYEIRWTKHYSTTPYWIGPYAWGSSEFPIGLPRQGVRDDIVINPDIDQDKNLRSAKEIIGYKISASDDDIGHVEDFILDDENWTIRYMVVDTRNWLPGRKVLVSHLWIEFISWPERKVMVNLTKEQIEASPEYDPSAPVNREYEEQLYDYYGRPKYWKYFNAARKFGRDKTMKPDDQKMKAAIIMRIRRDTRINDAMIDVNVSNGLVTLDGIVSSYSKKLAVQMKAKKTRGVISVDNRLKVFYPQEYGTPPPEEIKATAKTVLTAHPDIDATKIDIGIDAGVVTLKGSVKFFWQLHRVEEMTSNIIGVVDLKNELAVVPTEKISDEIIAAQIIEELVDSESVDQSQILVEVEDGAVILSGTVRNYADRNEVYNAAVHKPGIKYITNNISVATA